MENKLNILPIQTGPLAVNTYIVWRDGFDSCVVIDPASSNKVLEQTNKLSLKISAILITHGHFDHILGVKRLADETRAKIVISRVDAPALKDGRACLASMIGVRFEPAKADVLLKDGDEFTYSGVTFRAILTPGHTKGGMCFVVEDEKVIFSGDTLFFASYGRSDLPGGDSAALCDSIIYRLFSLKGDYRVLPGHDRETTLEFERNNNPCAIYGICQ
ncbi:MAG: MBL fold metallo-hydrolase [Clostridia bacterium]|nr:MBL fold metallo-hydrolase [Clostridia bacterium]